MKTLYIITIICAIAVTTEAQDFNKNMASAKSAYASGKLEDARYAMEQMLADIDVVIGKEILKLLPGQLGALKTVPTEDNVTGSSAGIAAGLYVHRMYGSAPKTAALEIINNSPLINSIGMLLNTPMMGGMMKNENQKTLKIQGYKSLLTKNLDSETGKTNYELQIPLNNTLFTLKVDETTEAEITGFANTLPLSKIQQLAQ